MGEEDIYQIQEPPAPWRHVGTWAVGGLLQVGYAQDTDNLLVMSTQGRGVFDCVAGQRIARDSDETVDYFDQEHLIAEGIGPLAGAQVHTAGLLGGELTRFTRDRWSVSSYTKWEKLTGIPVDIILLSPPNEDQRGSRSSTIATSGACELRAFGFSETGKSLVVALSCDLILFTR